MTDNINIRQIDFSERHLVIELFDQYRAFYRQSCDKALAERFISERLLRNESVIFVVLVKTGTSYSPAGFTQLYPMYSSVRAIKIWLLNDLYVDTANRRQGIGKKLIQTAADFARSDKGSYLQLETATDNYPAQGLYESLGFKKHEPDSAFLTYSLKLH